MPKFAANLSMLYTELEFLDRIDAAAQAGFKGVEYMFPYPYRKEELVERLEAHGLTQVLHNLPAGAEGKLEGYDIDGANLLARDLGVRLELVPVPSAERIAYLLTNKNAAAAAMAKRHPEARIERKFVLKESPASIGVRQGEPSLLQWVDVFVFYRKLSGDLDQLSRKWFGEPLPALPVF